MINLVTLAGGLMLQKMLDMFKKPIVGWIGALIIGFSAAALNMSYEDVKSAICSQPTPKVEAAPAVK